MRRPEKIFCFLTDVLTVRKQDIRAAWADVVFSESTEGLPMERRANDLGAGTLSLFCTVAFIASVGSSM